MWPNPQETARLVTFTEENLDGILHFLCSVSKKVVAIFFFTFLICPEWSWIVKILKVVSKVTEKFPRIPHHWTNFWFLENGLIIVDRQLFKVNQNSPKSACSKLAITLMVYSNIFQNMFKINDKLGRLQHLFRVFLLLTLTSFFC